MALWATFKSFGPSFYILWGRGSSPEVRHASLLGIIVIFAAIILIMTDYSKLILVIIGCALNHIRNPCMI